MSFRFDKNFRTIYTGNNNDIGELFNRIENMNIHEIKTFSLQNKLPLYITDSNGNNLIHHVLLNNDVTKTEIQKLNIIKYLYNENVNPDQPNSDNITPLHLTCKYQLESITNYFINLGCNVNYQDNNGNTCLHYLLSGKYSIYKNLENKSLFSLSKKINDKTEDLLDLKKELWKIIKEEDFFKQVEKTLESSVGQSTETRDLLVDFVDKLVKNDLSLNKKNELEQLQFLVSSKIIDYINLIKRKWNGYDIPLDIEVHTNDDLTSWPPSNNYNFNDLKLIRNYNFDIEIKNDVNDKIDDILELLTPEKIFEKYENIYEDYNPLKKKLGVSLVNNLELVPNFLYPNNKLDPNNFDKSKYDEINKIFSLDFITSADNIINLDTNTFIGGNYMIDITMPSDKDKFKDSIYDDNFDKKQYIDNIIDKYIVIDGLIATFLKKYIFDNNDYNDELENLLETYKNHVYYKCLLQAKKYDYLKKKGKWLYSFITLYYLVNRVPPVIELSIPYELIIIICSLIHNTTIQYACKNYFISIILNNNLDNTIENLKSILKNWISFLFSDKTDDINNFDEFNNFDNMIEYFFSDNKKQINNQLDSENKVKYENMLSSELICLYLKQEYEKLTEKPLLQHLVDTISILRFIEINSESNIVETSKKLLMYMNQGDNNSISNLIDLQNDIFKSEFILLDFKKLFSPGDIDFRKIYNLTYNFTPSTIYFILDDIDNFKRKKYIEAKCLGLQYLGVLDEINVPSYTNNHTLLLLEYVKSRNNTYKSTNYFDIIGNVYRPLTKKNLSNFIHKKLNVIIKFQNYILSNSNGLTLKDIFEDLKDDYTSKHYDKILPVYYPILHTLNQHFTFLFNEGGEMISYKRNNKLYDLSKKLNDLNSYVYLIHYLNSYKFEDGKKFKIPKFFYYSLPEEDDIKTDYYMFSKSNEDNILDYDSSDQETDIGNIEKNEQNYIFNNRNISYRDILDNISMTTLKSKIKDEYYRATRKNKLPPSFIRNLGEFFRFNSIEIIISILDKYKQGNLNSINKIINESILKNKDTDDYLNIQNKEIDQYFILAKIAEEILKSYFEYKVDKIGIKIFSELLDKNGYKNTFLNKKLNKVDVLNLLQKDDLDFNDKIIKETPDENLYDLIINLPIDEAYYPFSEPTKKTDSRIIKMIDYTDDYSTLNLFNTKYEITINNNIFKELNKVSNKTILNLENRNFIEPLLKSLNVDMIKELVSEDSELLKTFYNDIENKYKIHKNQFENEHKEINNQIDSFTFTQYKEIEELIFANEDFNNNILRNLRLSFNVCAYITIHFISERSFNFSVLNLKYTDFISSSSPSGGNTIDRYEKLANTSISKSVYMFNWKNFFKDNNNFVNSDELKSLNDKIPNTQFLQDYFKMSRYTDSNPILEIVKNLLVHLTKSIICNGFVVIIKKIMYEEIKNKFSENDVNTISEIIKVRLYNIENELFNSKDSIANKMVVNSVSIFKNLEDETSHENETIEDILLNYINKIEKESEPYKLSEITITRLKSDVVKYFDTIGSKTINNWNVVIENIFRFIINQNRYQQILTLINYP